MSRLGHWHPMLASGDLRRGRAVGVRLAGQDIALFRDADGTIGAVEDRCAHRRMKLSLGRVAAGRIVCPYHGWSYAPDGSGTSPANPRLRPCVTGYDTAELAGVVWVRAHGATGALPDFALAGCDYAGAVFNAVRAPLELVIDNFSEVEHTVKMHADFGFVLDRAEDIVVDLTCEPDNVTVRNRGPAKPPPYETRFVAAIRRGDLFHADYSFRFDPPCSAVTHWWTDPRTGAARRLTYHLFHYFVPEDAARTKIISFAFLKLDWPVLRPLRRQIAWIFRRKLRQAIDEDAFLLEHLADSSASLEGMRLGRFDQVLAHTRERLSRIYDA